jgi:hypothetical protein
MKICTNNELIATIDLDECLGLSLATINTNFDLLRESNCFTNEEINLRQTQIEELSSKITHLSLEATAVPKVFTTFNASDNPISFEGLRIKNVTSPSTGVFKLSFDANFSDSNYAIIGTCSNLSAEDMITSWVQISANTLTPTSCVINIQNISGVRINPKYVSISIFNL